MSLNLIGNQVVTQRVEAIWARVFQNSNSVIRDARLYGFLGIELVPSPNIHQIVVQLQAFDHLIDILLSVQGHLHYDQVKQLLNAKSQLLAMGRLASALKANNEQDFETAVKELEQQAVI